MANWPEDPSCVTYVVRWHSIVRLAVAQQHAETIGGVVCLASTRGLLVAQEPEYIIRKQDLRAIQVTDNVWHWREWKRVRDFDDLG